MHDVKRCFRVERSLGVVVVVCHASLAPVLARCHCRSRGFIQGPMLSRLHLATVLQLRRVGAPLCAVCPAVRCVGRVCTIREI